MPRPLNTMRSSPPPAPRSAPAIRSALRPVATGPADAITRAAANAVPAGGSSIDIWIIGTSSAGRPGACPIEHAPPSAQSAFPAMHQRPPAGDHTHVNELLHVMHARADPAPSAAATTIPIPIHHLRIVRLLAGA